MTSCKKVGGGWDHLQQFKNKRNICKKGGGQEFRSLLNCLLAYSLCFVCLLTFLLNCILAYMPTYLLDYLITCLLAYLTTCQLDSSLP